MECCRIVFMFVLAIAMIVACSARSESCGVNERTNSANSCQRTCNACRDCGPCHCKTGYIRQALGGACIADSECHKLHLQWLHDAKYDHKKDKFFNCL